LSDPFHPTVNATANIDVSAASQRVLVSLDQGPLSVRVMNNGTATVWINFGDATVTASLTTGVPVGAGVIEVFTFDNTGQGAIYAASIAAGSTGKIYFTPGRGA